MPDEQQWPDTLYLIMDDITDEVWTGKGWIRQEDIVAGTAIPVMTNERAAAEQLALARKLRRFCSIRAIERIASTT